MSVGVGDRVALAVPVGGVALPVRVPEAEAEAVPVGVGAAVGLADGVAVGEPWDGVGVRDVRDCDGEGGLEVGDGVSTGDGVRVIVDVRARDALALGVGLGLGVTVERDAEGVGLPLGLSVTVNVEQLRDSERCVIIGDCERLGLGVAVEVPDALWVCVGAPEGVAVVVPVPDRDWVALRERVPVPRVDGVGDELALQDALHGAVADGVREDGVGEALPGLGLALRDRDDAVRERGLGVRVQEGERGCEAVGVGVQERVLGEALRRVAVGVRLGGLGRGVWVRVGVSESVGEALRDQRSLRVALGVRVAVPDVEPLIRTVAVCVREGGLRDGVGERAALAEAEKVTVDREGLLGDGVGVWDWVTVADADAVRP